MSWSSGKDSAWALRKLREEKGLEVVGLLTTFNTHFNRVSMHGVRSELVEQQAQRLSLPLWRVELPWPCSNQIYEEKMGELIERAKKQGIEAIAFGDLFLEDIRDYRIKQLSGTGIEPLFPAWVGRDKTAELAEKMLEIGIRAVLTCVDLKKLPLHFAGQSFDRQFLGSLPIGIDPCGENGEFHSFCFDSPDFSSPISVQPLEPFERDGFGYCELIESSEFRV